MKLHIGCCGWGTARARYFREFEAVEVQQTFYDPPRPSTLQRWRAEAPPAFRFTMKCFQVVTHPPTSPTYRRLRHPLANPHQAGFLRASEVVWAAWQATTAAAAALAAEVVLLQTPASFRPTSEHLANLRSFAARARCQVRALAFEPRGAAWEPSTADRLCTELGWLRACDPLTTKPPSPLQQRVAYFRLHGIGGYRYTFTDADLTTLARLVETYDEAWVFFNNVSMREDALRFVRMFG